MGTVNYTPPNDGTEIKAKHLRDLWIALSTAVNGGIDADNLEASSITSGKLAGEIPATKMEDSGDLELFINETMSDHVVSGCAWTIDSGLIADMSSGYVRINGVRYSISAVSNRTFTNNVDTYCDVGINGTVDYNEVATNATAPALAADHVRLAIVKSSGGSIGSIQSMAVNPGFLTDGFQEIARTTLSGAGDTITVSSIPRRNYLRIIFFGIATGGTLDTQIQFNGDTASNYIGYAAAAMAAGASTGAIAQFNGESGATDSGGSNYVVMDITNRAIYEKLMTSRHVSQDAVGAATVPAVYEQLGKWANTSSQIRTVTWTNGTGTGDFAIGSEVIILGKD